MELVDDAMGDDYAKLGGLTSEEDLNEPTIISMKKRLPWLIILLFLGMGVSSVVGIFESVVAVLPIVICFQSLVLDMAGNVGTQSLAVTIRVLMDENLNTRKKLYLLGKEMRIGFFNGISLGLMALVFLGVYIHFFKKYACRPLTDCGHGRFQHDRHHCANVFPQNPRGPGGCIRPADHNCQRSGSCRYILWTGNGIPD